MKKRDQPHDRFYKDLMQDIEVAREFLLNYLDQDIRARIDWDTLALYDTSLIGEANKQLYADVMYAAQTKQHKSEVFFILNHQRKADPLPRNLEIAKNMLLNLHLGIDVVQKATGLSRAELKKLQAER